MSDELFICCFVTVSMWLLYQQLGLASLVSLGSLIIVLPIQSVLVKRSAVFVKKAAYSSDERTKLQGELLSGENKAHVIEKPAGSGGRLGRKSWFSPTTESWNFSVLCSKPNASYNGLKRLGVQGDIMRTGIMVLLQTLRMLLWL